ncbi:GTP cyclohydrolase 1 [compost metagenome]
MSYEYMNVVVKDNQEQIESLVKELLRLIGEDVERDGLLDTPNRVAKMYLEIFSGYGADYEKILGVTFDEKHEELVIVKDIPYFSQCEHHMVPFFGKVHIGYIPNGKIAGLSKFARLVDAITRKLQVQERVTTQIANILEQHLQPKGVVVVVEGEHLCMCSRGVRKSGTNTITSAVRGNFKSDPSLRAEFMSLIKK